jgi:protein TonB
LCDLKRISADATIDSHGHFGAGVSQAYLKAVESKVQQNWYALIPESAKFPTKRKGCVNVEFSLWPDGTLSQTRIIETSSNQELDEAAWNAVMKSSPFQSFPTSPAPVKTKHYFTVMIHFRFLYNPRPGYRATPSDLINPDSPLARPRIMSTAPLPSSSAQVTTIRSEILPVGDLTPVGIFTPDPTYTPQSSAPTKDGAVLVSFTVSKKGQVHRLKVLLGLTPAQDKAVRRTIATWKFKPATRDGKSVNVPLEVQVMFNSKLSTIH